MSMFKNLLFTAIFIAFSSSISCSIKQPTNLTAEHPLTELELTEAENISLLNITNINLFISFLSVSAESDSPIIARMLPSMSFTTVILDEKERFQNITLLIEARTEKQFTGYYSEDLIKKYVTFVLNPQTIAGLDEIRLEIEDEQLIAYLSYNFTNIHTCNICRKKFEDSAQVTILECGHVLHRECLESYRVPGNDSAKCPTCNKQINQQESLSKLAKSKTRIVLYPVSRLINTNPKRSINIRNISEKKTCHKKSIKK